MAVTHNSRAEDIAAQFLSEVNEAILTRDFSLYRSLIDLPYQVFSFDGHLRAEAEADLRTMFDRVTAFYQRCNVTDLIRIVREVSQPSPDRLRCLYETREITERDVLQGEPFFCLMELVHKEGRWVVQRSEYDIMPTSVRHDVLIGKAASRPSE